MKYEDRITVIGNYQGRLMLFIIESLGEDYICKKAVNLGKEEKLAVHSIINQGNVVYLADSYNNKICKLDFDLNEFNEESVGRDPRHMCIADNNMYVANFESDNISAIDLLNFIIIESIPTGIKPHDIIYNKNNDKIYTCCYEENEIIEYSPKREINRRLTTDGKPMHMFIADNTIILMAYFTNGNVHTRINFINIETGKIENIIQIEGLASDFDIDYNRNLLFVINIDDKKLYIINIAKKEIVKLIFLGGYPEGLTVGEKYIYISNSKKNQIAVIDGDKLIIDRLINLNFTPSCIKIIEDRM